MGLVPNVRDLVQKTPNGVLLVCFTTIAVVIIGSLTLLAWGNKDATELRSLINTLMNIAAIVLSGGSFLYAGVAANRSDEAAKNTNGKLHETVTKSVQDAVTTALDERKIDG